MSHLIYVPKTVSFGKKAIEHLIDLINLKNKFGNIVIFIDKNFYTMNKELPFFRNIPKKNI